MTHSNVLFLRLPQENLDSERLFRLLAETIRQLGNHRILETPFPPSSPSTLSSSCVLALWLQNISHPRFSIIKLYRIVNNLVINVGSMETR